VEYKQDPVKQSVNDPNVVMTMNISVHHQSLMESFDIQPSVVVISQLDDPSM
jgi:hypothetical protein